MTTTPRPSSSVLTARRRALTGLALLPLLVGGLAACGGEDLGAGLAERAVEQAGGGEVDVDVDGEDVTITGEDGTVVSSGSDLPEDFPDDVPLLEEQVVSAVAAGGASGEGWAVSMVSDRPAAEVLEEAVALLEDAGFTRDEQGSMTMGEMSVAVLGNGTWQVSVTAIDSVGTTLQYLVAPAPA